MEIEQRAFNAIRRITRASDIHSRALMQDHKLTGPQLAVLKAIAARGKAPIGLLAKTTHTGAPTVTGVVDRLEQQGLAERVHAERDRRQIHVALTQDGETILRSNPPLLNQRLVAGLLEMPCDERELVCTVLERVAAMMEPIENRTADS